VGPVSKSENEERVFRAAARSVSPQLTRVRSM
jgi:hypothetical protein